MAKWHTKQNIRTQKRATCGFFGKNGLKQDNKEQDEAGEEAQAEEQLYYLKFRATVIDHVLVPQGSSDCVLVILYINVRHGKTVRTLHFYSKVKILTVLHNHITLYILKH